MSSFLKKGLRSQKVKKDKETKRHVKEFYKIIGVINEITDSLDPNISYTEDNINEYTLPFLGRDLDDMEKFLILGKLEMNNKTNKKDEQN